jgi:hypothetical protein
LAGEKTVHWDIMFNALKDLGVTCISILNQGGNQPIAEFIDPQHPSMKIWTDFADVQGY